MKKIFTVTLNPVVDLIYSTEGFEKGTTFRCDAYQRVPAGKGLNVSYILSALGVESEAWMLLGESDVSLYESVCQDRGVSLKPFTGGFDVRRHCTILERGGGVTHVQTRGLDIKPEWAEDLIRALTHAVSADDIVVFSGSLPPGLDDGLYASAIRRCRMEGALTLLDASGEPLRQGAAAHPFAVKINEFEARELTGKSISGPQDEYTVLQAVHRLSSIPLAAISLGGRGLIAGGEQGAWRIQVHMNPGEVRDTVGCGDALMAGFVKKLAEGKPEEECFRHGVAVASAAARVAGPGVVNPADVESLMDRIESHRIGT